MQAILSLAGKNRGDASMCLWHKEREKVAGKIQSQGSQGSIELNINSSLCFGKNSHFFPLRFMAQALLAWTIN